MNCNVHAFCKLVVSNKFGFIQETVFSYVGTQKLSFSVVQREAIIVFIVQEA